MKKKLLSIGEVAAMKNISIKGLRYYEKIGILKPTYINPDNGYRYYSMSQMIDIDLISTCLELDIPLKGLTKHIGDDGVLDLEALLLEGQSIAIEKIRKSQAALARINGGMREIHDQKSVAQLCSPYTRKLPSCTLLCMSWNHDMFLGKEYIRAISSLYHKAEEHGIVALYTQGMIYHAHPQLPGWSVYVEAHIPDYAPFFLDAPYKELDQTDATHYALVQLERKSYQGLRIVRENFEMCFQTIFEQYRHYPDMLIASDIWSVDHNSYLVEVLQDIKNGAR